MSDQKPASAQDVIDTLKSIDNGIKALCAHFGVGAAVGSALAAAQQDLQNRQARAIPQIATDRDLDSQYGDPAVRAKSPRDWTGEDQMGKPFSECPPEYLEMVADRLDYFSETETDEKKLKYQRLDASRARGWAKRLREGWQPPEEDADEPAFPSDSPLSDVNSDDIPF